MLDGLVAVEDRAASATEFKKFIQELQAQAGLYGCTVFLLTTAKGQAIPPEHTMVDGIIELTNLRHRSPAPSGGSSSTNFASSNVLPGRHPFLDHSRWPRCLPPYRGGFPPDHAPGRGARRQALHRDRGP